MGIFFWFKDFFLTRIKHVPHACGLKTSITDMHDNSTMQNQLFWTICCSGTLNWDLFPSEIDQWRGINALTESKTFVTQTFLATFESYENFFEKVQELSGVFRKLRKCQTILLGKRNHTFQIDPLTPMSAQDRISPYNINTISTR